jgi:RNA polymerase sigma factor (sigma-70 family)
MANGTTDEERARFRHVVLPYLADCYALARWLTGARADAEDVVQEACLRALRAIGGFAGSNARAWTLTIVRNTAYSWLRKNRPAALVIVDDLETIERAQSNPGTTGETPEAMLIAKTEAVRLQRAIAELPVPFRETLVLRDVHGLGYRDIAEVTGVPIGTVMSRLARARSRLIATMEADAP